MRSQILARLPQQFCVLVELHASRTELLLGCLASFKTRQDVDRVLTDMGE
jgi:hypothetical protein